MQDAAPGGSYEIYSPEAVEQELQKDGRTQIFQPKNVGYASTQDGSKHGGQFRINVYLWKVTTTPRL